MASFGETLKRERELREISLRQISEATKISIRYLEALEQNRFELLPGGLFNKGFIRAYATYVGLDGESMVNSYLHQVASSAPATEPGPAVGPPPGLHRPAYVPQRRAVQRPEPAAPATPPAAAADVAPAQSHGVDRAAPARSISGIEAVDRTATSSRALLWIFSLVAGAGVVFLVLTLATGRAPQQTDPPPVPADAAIGTAPVPIPIDPSTPSTAEPQPTAPPPRAETREAAAPAIASVGGRRAELPTTTHLPRARDDNAPPEKEEEKNDEEARPRRAESQPGSVPMELQVEPAASAWVQITCDGQRVVDGMMRPGETMTTECLNVIRVSATDAGAVSLTINGAPCLPLGEPGTRVYGYTIRSDDFRQICPPPARGPDGRF